MSKQRPQRQQTSNLLELNPQLSLAGGVYQNTSTQIRESKLSNYIRITVTDIYENVSDLSLFSIDIEKRLQTDELRSALSPTPVNFLLSFDLENIGHTLDLTQDFGGVSHYLADKVCSIDSVKIDIAHAKLSVKRCAEFDNINTISEEICDLSLAEKSYDLIVISHIEDLGLNKCEQIEWLAKLQLALSQTGRLVVNARNRDRVNKWTSTGTDITAYKNLYNNEVASDFTESELDTALKGAGFLHWDAYASFSPVRDIRNLLSRKYLSTHVHSLNHFNRLGGIGNGDLNEYLLFRNLHDERGQVFNLASRFIMIASASATRSQQLCNNNFAHFSGIARKPQWRTTTQCKEGSNEVSKTLLHPNFKVTEHANSDIKLSQNTDIQAFQSGTLLLDEWLTALLSNNPADTLKSLVTEYAQWLTQLQQQGDFSSHAYDVLPFNIIVSQIDDNRRFNVIDPEWVVDADFGTDFILFRALFWFAFENKVLLKELAKKTGISTIGLFILHYMENLNSHEELGKFVQMEEEIQRQISMSFRNKSIEYALLQTFDGESMPQRLQPICQVSWSDDAGSVDEHNSVFILWKASTEEQALSHASPTFTKGKNVLRIDPIASLGLFKFSSVKLVSKNNSIIWQLNSASDIAEGSDALNISSAKDSAGETCFTALNEDPHFLFDLINVENLDAASIIEVTFALIHNQYYDNALATLSDAVGKQNVALFRQVGVLDTKEAEIQYLSSKLAHTDQHRQALQASIHEAHSAHKEHAKNLTEALEQQTNRTQQLENNFIINVVLRCKRIAARILAK